MDSTNLIDLAVEKGIIEFFCKGGKKRKIHGKWLGGTRKGVMVAIPVDPEVDEIEAPKTIGVGFSLCKTKPSAEERAAGVIPDEFDAMFGIRVASFRATCEKPMVVPYSMKRKVQKFMARTNRYFKNAKIVTNLVFEEKKNENTGAASDKMEAAD